MERMTANKKNLREDLRKIPKALIIGEFLLTFVLLRYLLNFTSMVSPTEGDWIQVWANLQSIIVSLLMAILTVGSIVGIPSAKPQSWRQVVRSAVLLNIINWYYVYLEKKEFLRHEYDRPFEITSIIGNVTRKENEVYLHIHIDLADETMNVIGGHLNECRISATAELFVRVLDGEVGRMTDEKTGLNLFRFE